MNKTIFITLVALGYVYLAVYFGLCFYVVHRTGSTEGLAGIGHVLSMLFANVLVLSGRPTK